MGYVRHTFDSPTPNEEHEVVLDASDFPEIETSLKKQKDDIEDLNVFLQL